MFTESRTNWTSEMRYSLSSQASHNSSSCHTPMTSSYSNPLEQRENFKVCIRVRPPLPREIDSTYGFAPIVSISPDHKSISVQEYLGAAANDMEREQDIINNPGIATYHHFSFDFVYDQESTQMQVYDRTARPAVLSVLEGYNATLLAYGQTGTGKTYTMEGFKYNGTDPQRGIIPRASEEIFKSIESSQSANNTFMVRASYLQIYNENISDLLKPDRGSLQIREERRKGVFVEGLSEWAVRSPGEICTLMQKGQMTRATASTKMNDISSRSHAVFIIIVEMMSTEDYDQEATKQIKVGKLNLVDLAGSERVRVTGATGKRLEESKKINQSLSALGNVIAALTDVKARSHIPYRDSKLTRLLEDSLGGNCKTTMIAMISPAQEAFGESLSTIKFANRAKNIRNAPRINEDVDQKALLRKYEVQLKRLQNELEAKNKSVIDMQRLLELEEDKRRAEADREAAIEALERRSREYLQEKEEKRKLEERIKMMNSQLLIGGKKLEETPQFITALEEKQKAIRKEYENRLQEIERERQQIEEDKAQIDRYKQLLLRQRDIMIALTARLNERDETIIQLQEELDAYDKIHKETEETLEYKAARCDQMEGILKMHNLEVPTDDTPDTNYFKDPKKYPPYSTDSLTLDADSYVPLQMLTAEEKITELTQIIESQKAELAQKSPVRSARRPEYEIEQMKNLEYELREKISSLESQNDKTLKEKNSIKTLLETSLLPQVEGLFRSVQESYGTNFPWLNELQNIYKTTHLSISLVRHDPDSQPRRNIELHIPRQNEKVSKLDLKANGRTRPLTVDEMLTLKRQEMQRKREQDSS